MINILILAGQMVMIFICYMAFGGDAFSIKAMVTLTWSAIILTALYLGLMAVAMKVFGSKEWVDINPKETKYEMMWEGFFSFFLAMNLIYHSALITAVFFIVIATLSLITSVAINRIVDASLIEILKSGEG